jgi:hypothetical protein
VINYQLSHEFNRDAAARIKINAGRQPEKGKIIASTEGFLPAAGASGLL